MDRQLLERLIGAVVLVIALVVVAPSLLDGREDADRVEQRVALPGAALDGALDSDAPLRSHTIRLGETAEQPPVARQLASAAPDAAAGPDPGTEPAGEPVGQRAPTAEEVARLASIAPAAGRPATPPAAPSGAVVVAAAPPPRTAPASTRAKAGDWAVQLGSFGARANAERLAAQLSQRGFDAFVVSVRRDGRTLHRVRAGPAASRAEATALAGRLADAGWPGQVVRHGA